MKTGEFVKIVTDESYTVNADSVAISHDSKYLACSYSDGIDHVNGIVKIFEIETAKLTKTLTGHAKKISSVSYTPDGKYLATGSEDSTLKVWDVGSGKCLTTISDIIVGMQGETSIIYSPDGKVLTTLHKDNTIKLWEVASRRCVKILTPKTTGHPALPGDIRSIAYTPDGRCLAVADWEKNIKLLEVETGIELKTLRSYAGFAGEAKYSPDGTYMVSGMGNGSIKLWKMASGKFKILSGHTDSINDIIYSPDGAYLVTSSDDSTIKLWEVASSKCVKTFIGHTDGVDSIVYSSDGKYITSGSSDNTIKIWEVVTGECVKTFECGGPVTSVCYRPDGTYLASCSWDGSIKIWNVATGECINTLTGHTDWVNSVCYSSDGAYLASGSKDNTIKFWNASTGALLATTFNLKDGEWLTYTPEGFFAGSEWATKNLVHIVDGMKTVGIDQMYDSLYRPDLVSAKLSGEDISPYAQKVNFASLVQTGSAPVVTFLSLEDEVKERDVAIEFAIQNTGGGIGEVNLLLNGKNIRLAENVASKSGETVHFSHTITLQNGKNTVELYAKNEAGKVESLRVNKTLKWQGAVKKPNLYIFTVAINQYRDRELRLKYAVPDAEFILKGFSSQKKSLYQNIFTHHLFDDNVTRDGLKSSFEKLGNEVQADDWNSQ